MTLYLRLENLEHVTPAMKPLHVALRSPPQLSAHLPRPEALICLFSADSVGLLASVFRLLCLNLPPQLILLQAGWIWRQVQGWQVGVQTKLFCMKSCGLGPALPVAMRPLSPETRQAGLLGSPERGLESSRGIWKAGPNTEPHTSYS